MSIMYYEIDQADRERINTFITDKWMSLLMVVHGEAVNLALADGWYACDGEEIVGLLTYRITGDSMEILSLDSLHEQQGIGSALLGKAVEKAKESGLRKISLITTNDNLNALRFYQKQGFDMVRIYPNVLEHARRMKPEIPMTGNDGIPLKHEIEMEMILKPEGAGIPIPGMPIPGMPIPGMAPPDFPIPGMTPPEGMPPGRPDEFLFKDQVTSLPNMAALWMLANEKVQALRAEGKQPAVVYLDVISMHSYNTHFGYDKGNELLRLIAETIDKEFGGSLLGRGPDDHFVLLYEYNGDDEIREKIDAINHSIREATDNTSEGVRAGVCALREDTDAVRGLDLARQALKDIGREMNANCGFYSPKRDDEFWKERYVVENFDTAMEKQWIKVFYQPIISTKTCEIEVLEALARWVDPERGMISPGDFIPVLSRHHLLYKLDLYMAEQVSREFKLRIAAGLPKIPVSVNFSAQDFDHVDVPGSLREIVERNGITPQDIIVEITEQDIAKGTDGFRLQLEQIRENGHRLWIDDFGSGYSSLNVITQYPVDRIKVDMDIIRHMDDNNGANRKILKALVGVCRELGMHTLSEGVETKEQQEFLSEIECEMLQGFYFYKPIPLEVYLQKNP